MADPRDLNWDGCLNVRDLGGLLTATGAKTRTGAVVRSDHPAHLTAVGWSALWDYGIRTIISLETANAAPEVDAQANRRFTVPEHVPRLAHVRVGIEDADDADFMTTWAENGLWNTPLYYQDALARWPERHAEAVAAIAHAAPGGVLIHCGRGCDRTGIVSILLLALAGVSPHQIAEDYARSSVRLAPREPEYRQQLIATLAERGTTVSEVIHGVVSSLDADAYLRSGGLTDHDLTRARNRLVGTS